MEDAAAGLAVDPQAIEGMVFVAYGAILMMLIAPVVFYLLSLRKALTFASPENRKMRPGLVWLNLLPPVSVIWHFYTVLKVSETITSILGNQRGDGGRFFGLAASLAWLGCWVALFWGEAAPAWVLTGRNELVLATLVLWVFYWIKVGSCNTQLQRIYNAQQAAKAESSPPA